MKQYKHGAVLGKFMPLHLGHEHLINTAIKHSEKVTVIVCTLPTEPIDGNIRYQWMCSRYAREIRLGTVEVVHLDEAWVPQEPSECHSDKVFYGTWAGIITAFCGEKPDAFFSSEEYGYPVANALGCEHYLVDLKRETFLVSGTKCRNNPFEMWDFMNENVRQHFAKKILIIGTESTGKSTLTTNLAAYYASIGYQTADVQEWAREWIDDALAGDSTKITFENITMFGNVQVKMVELAKLSGRNQLIFSDTDAVVSSVFQKAYFDKTDPKLFETAASEKWDLVLFTQPDVPWVDDGQRDFPHCRDELTARIRELMSTLGWSYVEVNGTWDERFKIATNAVDKLLSNDVRSTSIMV